MWSVAAAMATGTSCSAADAMAPWHTCAVADLARGVAHVFRRRGTFDPAPLTTATGEGAVGTLRVSGCAILERYGPDQTGTPLTVLLDLELRGELTMSTVRDSAEETFRAGIDGSFFNIATSVLTMSADDPVARTLEAMCIGGRG